MSARPQYDEKENEIVRMKKCGSAYMFNNAPGANFPLEEAIYNRPIAPKDNIKMIFRGEKPYWIPQVGFAYCDVNVFRPRQNVDNPAAHFVCDGEPPYQYGDNNVMKGWFDLEWVYVPMVGGSTIKPGTPLIDDMNEWEKYVVWPDLDAIDFEDMGKKNKEFMDTPQLNELCMNTSFWERLISFMDVEGAAIAMIDEDQKDAVKAFFDRYADFICKYVSKVKEVCDIDCFLTHDDWGHQRAPFFSLDTVREMLVPYLKRVTDHVHSLGMVFEMHSCGKNQDLVPAYIEAGVDFWNPQTMNDFDMMAEKYKDAPIYFGDTTVAYDASMPEEEVLKKANEWFEKHKNHHVFTAGRVANKTFQKEIYRLSRIEYSK